LPVARRCHGPSSGRAGFALFSSVVYLDGNADIGYAVFHIVVAAALCAWFARTTGTAAPMVGAVLGALFFLQMIVFVWSGFFSDDPGSVKTRVEDGAGLLAAVLTLVGAGWAIDTVVPPLSTGGGQRPRSQRGEQRDRMLILNASPLLPVAAWHHDLSRFSVDEAQQGQFAQPDVRERAQRDERTAGPHALRAIGERYAARLRQRRQRLLKRFLRLPSASGESDPTRLPRGPGGHGHRAERGALLLRRRALLHRPAAQGWPPIPRYRPGARATDGCGLIEDGDDIDVMGCTSTTEARRRIADARTVLLLQGGSRCAATQIGGLPPQFREVSNLQADRCVLLTDRPATAGRTKGITGMSITRKRCTTAVAGVLALAVLGGGTDVGTASEAFAASAASAAPGTAVASASVSASHARTTDFGYLTRLRTTKNGTTLALDRAILYTGPAAAAERAKRGLEPDVSDFYIANDNPRLRTYRVAPGVVVRGSQLLTGSAETKTVPLSTLRRHLEQRTQGSASVPFTLTFDRRGRVVVIEEMYLS
jgi:hypothetical protein